MSGEITRADCANVLTGRSPCSQSRHTIVAYRKSLYLPARGHGNGTLSRLSWQASRLVGTEDHGYCANRTRPSGRICRGWKGRGSESLSSFSLGCCPRRRDVLQTDARFPGRLFPGVAAGNRQGECIQIETLRIRIGLKNFTGLINEFALESHPLSLSEVFRSVRAPMVAKRAAGPFQVPCGSILFVGSRFGWLSSLSR